MNDSNQACITMNHQSQAGHADICSLLVRAGGASLQVWGERFGAEMIRLPYGNCSRSPFSLIIWCKNSRVNQSKMKIWSKHISWLPSPTYRVYIIALKNFDPVGNSPSSLVKIQARNHAGGTAQSDEGDDEEVGGSIDFFESGKLTMASTCL